MTIINANTCRSFSRTQFQERIINHQQEHNHTRIRTMFVVCFHSGDVRVRRVEKRDRWKINCTKRSPWGGLFNSVVMTKVIPFERIIDASKDLQRNAYLCVVFPSKQPFKQTLHFDRLQINQMITSFESFQIAIAVATAMTLSCCLSFQRGQILLILQLPIVGRLLIRLGTGACANKSCVGYNHAI